VEKAAALCVLDGFHADCNKETGRAAGRLIADALNRETVRGAARANDLMESMMRDMVMMR